MFPGVRQNTNYHLHRLLDPRFSVYTRSLMNLNRSLLFQNFPLTESFQ